MSNELNVILEILILIFLTVTCVKRDLSVCDAESCESIIGICVLLLVYPLVQFPIRLHLTFIHLEVL